MQVTFTNPATKEKLVLSEFSASILEPFSVALGKEHGTRFCHCDDEKAEIWPIKFHLTSTGIIDHLKEGRLRVDVTGLFTMDRGKAPENRGGYHVRLRREATDQDMGGYVVHDKIRAMVSEKEELLLGPAKTALLAAVAKVKKTEDTASSMHAARARVAGLVLGTLKSK